MSRGWVACGVLVGGLTGVLTQAPAVWLTPWVEQASDKRLRLNQASGTVWHGKAQLVVVGGPGDNAPVALPSSLSWRLVPGWTGLRMELSAPCCAAGPLIMAWAPSWGGWVLRLQDGESQWPAALLSGLGAPWNTLELAGQLHLQTESLVLLSSGDTLALGGAARLDALALSSRLSTLRPLGSYRLRLTTGVAAPTLALSTIEGGLQLSGSGQWTGAHWRFVGEASAAPDAEAVLGNLLNIVGRRQGAKAQITLG